MACSTLSLFSGSTGLHGPVRIETKLTKSLQEHRAGSTGLHGPVRIETLPPSSPCWAAGRSTGLHGPVRIETHGRHDGQRQTLPQHRPSRAGED